MRITCTDTNSMRILCLAKTCLRIGLLGMATLNISLPDELKMRMDATNENWSAIARRAFELQLNSTMKVGEDMEAVIERLRASKQKIEQEQRPEWTKEGREWAMYFAEYDQLQRIVKLANEVANFPDADALLAALFVAMNEETPDRDVLLEFGEALSGNEQRQPTLDQLRWHLEGVQQVWNEISSKV